jgi:hypothetical protein
VTLPVETRSTVASANGTGPGKSSTIANLLLFVATAQPGSRPKLEAVRQAATALRWAGEAAPLSLASGSFGGSAIGGS